MTHLKKLDKKLPCSWKFGALGTAWSIDTHVELGADIRQAISQRIEAFDKTYSRFRHDSLVARLRTPGEYEFPSDFNRLFTLYDALYKITIGSMTPLIGDVLERAGYDREYSFTPKGSGNVLPFAALGWDSKRTLRTKNPLVLDVGAAGKGYLVDILSELLEQGSVHEYTIDASGDIKQKGYGEIIGLEHPADHTKVIGTANVKDASLCASAINRRAWQDFHHIIDANTKQPVRNITATWVVAKSTLLADGLATALFFTPGAKLQEYFEFDWVVMDAKGRVDVSPRFNGELFI